MRAREIELLLPEVIRRTIVPGSPMSALVAVMEAMHAPAEQALAGLGDTLDPLVTADRFVPMLAAWVDLARLDETAAGRIELDRLRLLVSLAAHVGRRRGTASGLAEVLRLATGVEGLALEEVGPFRYRVVVPASGAAVVGLVAELVEQEKPAHVVVEVVVSGPDAGASGGGDGSGALTAESSVTTMPAVASGTVAPGAASGAPPVAGGST